MSFQFHEFQIIITLTVLHFSFPVRAFLTEVQTRTKIPVYNNSTKNRVEMSKQKRVTASK